MSTIYSRCSLFLDYFTYESGGFMKKQCKLDYFLLGQIMLSIATILLIVFMGNQIFRDDLQDVKQLRKDAEVAKMKELVDNHIIIKQHQRQAGNKFANNVYIINFDLDLAEPIPKNYKQRHYSI